MTLLFVGCNRGETTGPTASSGSAESPVQLVATVGMVADIVQNVGGEHVQVTSICGPGIDPHLYSASRDDVRKMLSADAIFYCGLMLEGKLQQQLEQMSRDKPVIAVAAAIDPESLLHPAGTQPSDAAHADPHVWMDVALWSQTIDTVVDTLATLDPDHRGDYLTNADRLRNALDDLHQWARRTTATIPDEAKLLITSHDAFNYFGRAYGLDVEGVQGISTESEAGLQRINEVVDRLVQQKIQAVFVESSVNPKNIQALIEGAASRGHQVRRGGELFSDAMGAAGTAEGTYIGMMTHNVRTVTEALGGTVEPMSIATEVNPPSPAASQSGPSEPLAAEASSS